MALSAVCLYTALLLYIICMISNANIHEQIEGKECILIIDALLYARRGS